jgi:hypothetical protein
MTRKEEEKKRSIKWGYSLIIISLAFVVASGIMYYFYYQGEVPANDAQVAGKVKATGESWETTWTPQYGPSNIIIKTHSSNSADGYTADDEYRYFPAADCVLAPGYIPGTQNHRACYKLNGARSENSGRLRTIFSSPNCAQTGEGCDSYIKNTSHMHNSAYSTKETIWKGGAPVPTSWSLNGTIDNQSFTESWSSNGWVTKKVFYRSTTGDQKHAAILFTGKARLNNSGVPEFFAYRGVEHNGSDNLSRSGWMRYGELPIRDWGYTDSGGDARLPCDTHYHGEINGVRITTYDPKDGGRSMEEALLGASDKLSSNTTIYDELLQNMTPTGWTITGEFN